MRSVMRWVLPLLFLCVGGWCFAQSTNSGDIRGTVTDTSGAVIPGAKVTVVNVSTGVTKTVTTDSAGVYDTSSIVTGAYNVTFTMDGFEALERGPITLEVGFTQVNARLNVGSVKQKVVVTNGAVAEFHKAIAIDAKLPGVHFDLAELLKTSQNSEKKKEAQQEYRADLEQNPMDERAVRRMGEIDEGMGQFAQANAEFEKAVQMKPDDADANLDLANMLIRQGQQEKAQELLERVVQSDPTIALAHLKLSQLYRRKGMTKESDAQVELYKQYTALKDKLTARYKELQVQPDEILNGTVDAGVAAGGTPAR